MFFDCIFHGISIHYLMEFNFLYFHTILIYVFSMMLLIKYFHELDNMMEYSNKTPLSLAIQTGNPKIVELILSHAEVEVNTKLILIGLFFIQF